MKKILLIITAAALLFGITAFADGERDLFGEKYYLKDKDENNIVRYTYDVIDGEATITDAHIYADSIDLVFPAEIGGYPVKSVKYLSVEKVKGRVKEDGLKYDVLMNKQIKSVTFEDGIESLSHVDFTRCENLESVVFGDSIKELDRVYFSDCRKLKSVHLPSELEKSDITFWNCRSLEEAVIPNGVTEIREGCFRGCTSLKNIALNSGLKIIGESAFSGCAALSEIVIPESVEVIGRHAFSGCQSLKKINIPKKVDFINSGVFYGTGIEKLTLPENITGIDEHAFSYMPIKEITIPAKVKSIGKSAFSQCSELEKLTISDGTAVNKSAFSGCYNLSDVIVNGEMKRDLFEALLNAYGSETIPYIKKYFEEYDSDFIIFDGNYLAKYKGTDRNPVIPDGITELGEQAFHNARIDSVTFPGNKIDEIPPHCFQASEIKELTVPSTVGSIREYAFYGCYKLEKLTIESGVKSVSDNAFLNCSALKEENVSIAGGVHIGGEAFKQTQLDKDWMDGQEVPDTPKPTDTPEPSEKPQPSPAPSETPAPKTLLVDGKDMSVKIDDNVVTFPDAKPFIDDNDRTQIPVRAVAEMLDCTVNWNGEAKTAEITNKNGDTIKLTIDSSIMTVNDEPVVMDTAAIIKEERTYIPLRYVAEAMGLSVLWKD